MQQAAALRTRAQRTRPTVPPLAPLNAKGFLCLDPRIWPPLYRPQPGPCQAPAIPYGESELARRRRHAAGLGLGVAANVLLDASNDGTYSQARKAALLGRQDDLATMAAITRLADASLAGKVDQEFAAGRIAQLAAPPVAAVEAADFTGPLSAAEYAEKKRLDSVGATATALDNAQAAKLGEACHCEPRDFDAIDPVSGWGIYYVGEGVLLTPSKKCVGHGVLPSWLSRTWRNTVTLLTGPPQAAPPAPAQPVPYRPPVVVAPVPLPVPPPPPKGYL